MGVYIDFMENADEGIEINSIDELKIELEDFELETVEHAIHQNLIHQRR